MKAFLTIVAGSVFAAVAWVSITYNAHQPDPAFYISYGGTLLAFSLMSLVFGVIFFGFHTYFRVRAANVVWLGGAALVTQLAVYALAQTLLFDFGVFGLAIASIVLCAVANFILDRLA